MVEPLQFLLILNLIASYAIAQETPSSPIIRTKSGPIRGILLNLEVTDPTTITTRNVTVYQFSGIPFAEPPTGDRRYRKPTPVRPWNDTLILDASRIPNVCIQSGNDFPTSEDCLYLNIWVPNDFLDSFLDQTALDNLLSTYVYIHGGAFIGGWAYNGSIFSATNDVIVASIQYRLGSLGFAYFGTKDVPGNMGMWDQVEALKWIYENIGSFGGNKSDITIGGESAGAASVTFHLLSPYSRKYFKRAIVESGSAIAPWAARTPRQAMTVTNIMFQGASVRCYQVLLTGKTPLTANSSFDDKTKCLKSLDAATFPRADQAPAISGFGLPFAPVIDGDFLPRDPNEMIQSGNFYKVPLLIGANKDEGSMFLARTRIAMQLLPLRQSPNRAITDNTLNVTHYRAMIDDAMKTYFGGLLPTNQLILSVIELIYWPQSQTGYPRGENIVQALSQIIGDSSLLCPTYAWAQAFANVKDDPNPDWMGVRHADELPFVFGDLVPPNPLFSKKDASLSFTMMTFWANFIKYGNPNGITEDPEIQTWPTLSGDADCPGRLLEINSVNQVRANGSAIICGLRARECQVFSPGKHRSPSPDRDRENCLDNIKKYLNKFIQIASYFYLSRD